VCDLCDGKYVEMGIYPSDKSWFGRFSSLPTLVRHSIALIIFAGVLVSIGIIQFGSIDTAFAYVRGERLFLQPQVVTLDNCEVDTTLTTKFEVYNFTGQTVNILRASSDCSCVSTSDMPIEIPTGQRRQMNFRIEIPSHPGHYIQELFFVTDSREYPYLLSQVEEFVN